MESKKFTRKEVEEKNCRQSVMIVIDNLVYDVTAFLEDHPGGTEVLVDNGGKDASDCFHDIGHTEDARELMKTYEIGRVVDEEVRDVRSWNPTEAPDYDDGGLKGIINAWMPPICLAIFATILYIYVL